MATIKDVAKLSGVAPSTVSRALSGKRTLSEDTKKRIFDAIKVLGYKPNPVAQALRGKRSNTVALIIPDIRNYIFADLIRGAESVLDKHGYSLILYNTDEDQNKELNYIKKMENNWVDGYIFATAGSTAVDDYITNGRNTPRIYVIRNGPQGVSSITVDNYNSMYVATEHLIKKGLKKIAIINGDLSIKLYEDRFNGYKKALSNNGIPIGPCLEIKSESINMVEQVRGFLYNNPVEAIIGTTDKKAIAAMAVIKDMGLKIPENVSIIGFDNYEMSMYTSPQLTTIAQPFYEIGEKAAYMLLHQMNGNVTPVDSLVYNCELIVRQST